MDLPSLEGPPSDSFLVRCRAQGPYEALRALVSAAYPACSEATVDVLIAIVANDCSPLGLIMLCFDRDSLFAAVEEHLPALQRAFEAAKQLENDKELAGELYEQEHRVHHPCCASTRVDHEQFFLRAGAGRVRAGELQPRGYY